MTSIDQLQDEISRLIAAVGKGISAGSKAAGCTVNILASETKMTITGEIAFTGEVLAGRTESTEATSNNEEVRPEVKVTSTSTKYTEQANITGNDSIGTNLSGQIVTNSVPAT